MPLDGSRYPFKSLSYEGAKGNGEGLTRIPAPLGCFPATGVGETFKGISLSLGGIKEAQKWEASSAWFSDVMTQTWNRRHFDFKTFQHPPQVESFPRTITGSDLKTFGVAGNGRKAQLRRQFREMHSKRVLSKLPASEAPEKPDMLEGPRKREWVLVTTDELRELHEFEALLRKEKGLLSSQAALAFDRAKLSASEPLPVTKLAVENVCDREMKLARRHVEEITAERFHQAAKRQRRSIADRQDDRGQGATSVVIGTTDSRGRMSKSGGTGTTGIFSGAGGAGAVSYKTLVLNPKRKTRPRSRAFGAPAAPSDDALKRTGYSELPAARTIVVPGPNNFKLRELLRSKVPARSARWLELRRHSEAVAARGEREEMEFEENIQHWADRYTEAYERKLDYQWYYVLALRYGALSAVEFEGRATDSSRKVEGAPSKGRGARPGSLYLGRCEKGANGVQKRWRLYWPVKKARMYRASCLFQTLYRKYRMLGKWGPVIRFRVKYGRRKVLRAHFRGYRDGVARQKRVQQLIDRHLKGWEDKCLYAWIRFTKKTKENREQLAVSCLRRVIYSFAFKVFVAWHGYAEQCARVKRMMARNLSNPCFATWVEMTEVWKEEREIIYLATVLQKFVRGFHSRLRVTKIRLLFKRLRWVAKGKRARIDVWASIARRNRAAVEGEVFDQQEAERSARIEKDIAFRIELVQITTEAAATLEGAVNKYLTKGKGRKDLKEWAQASVAAAEAAASSPGWHGRRLPTLDECKEAIKAEKVAAAKAKAKEIARHNLMANVETPPSFICPNPKCMHTCPTEELYLSHTANDPCEGCPDVHRPDFARLHVVMLQPNIGLKRVKRLLERRRGIGRAVFAMKFWEALETFRHMQQGDPRYEQTMAELTNTYIDAETATMELPLSNGVRERCLAEAETLRSHTGGEKAKTKKEKKGFLGSIGSSISRVTGIGSTKHGDPWGDGKRDPRPFMEAQWEAFLMIKEDVDKAGFWGSDLHVKVQL